MRSGTAKLPVISTIVQGYLGALRHVVTYTVQTFLWVGIVVATQYLFERVAEWSDTGPFGAEIGVLSGWAPSIALLIGGMVIAVAAYRAVIVMEPPEWQRAVRIRRRELRLIGLALLYRVIGYLEFVVVTILIQLAVEIDWTLFGGGPIGYLAYSVTCSLLLAVTMTPFFGLAFPLAATDAPSGLFRRSFVWSRHYRWRLATIGFLSDLPFQIAAYAPFLLWESQSDGIRHLQLATYALINLVGVAMGTGAFAAAFKFIASRQHDRTYDVFD